MFLRRLIASLRRRSPLPRIDNRHRMLEVERLESRRMLATTSFSNAETLKIRGSKFMVST